MNLSAYGLAFLEGVGLILSPCILPILPIVLSLGVEGRNSRPYGIIIGFVGSFAALTILSRQLVVNLGIDVEIIRYVSFALLFLFALILIFDHLSEKFTQLTSRFANLGERVAQSQSNRGGFFGGLIMGAAIGVIWLPCAGPIMAAVIVQTVTQQTTWDTWLTLISFSAGASFPMLLLVLLGRKIMVQVSFLKSYTHIIRKVLGVIIIFSVLYFAGATDLLPANTDTTPDSKVVAQVNASQSSHGQLINGLKSPYAVPQITGASDWINSPPLSLNELQGKVVLIDFWTYSCINCVRTLPILTKWDATYRDQGLVIIGIHAPEFEFEKKLTNVQSAVKQHNINYAVVLDNDLKTWINFQNRYWPAHYLVNKEGQVVYVHFGEGNYDITEANIKYLLFQDSTEHTPKSNTLEVSKTSATVLTPETYLGYERAERFASSAAFIQDVSFAYPKIDAIPLNEWSLVSKWVVEKQCVTAQEANATIKLHFKAKKVFLVLGKTTLNPVTANVIINGHPAGKDGGKDVQQSKVIVTKDTLYELVSLESVQDGFLEVQSNAPGLQAYAFTFGS